MEKCFKNVLRNNRLDRLPETETEKTNLKRFIYNCFVYKTDQCQQSDVGSSHLAVRQSLPKYPSKMKCT